MLYTTLKVKVCLTVKLAWQQAEGFTMPKAFYKQGDVFLTQLSLRSSYQAEGSCNIALL